MQQLHRLVERIAAGNLSVLLFGETGVGKEVMAETIHRLSPRAGKPFLRLNCAAFSEALLASELFGHEKGAFSGADQPKPGLLESAQGGTVLLDEVGELTPSIQAKLLRVLEERAVLRVGGLRPRPVDVRFVAATNRDLEQEVARGAFRQDLLFRLDGFSIVIPPLRERLDELPGLVAAFVAEASTQLGRRRPPEIAPDVLSLLASYAWPGNVRELRNVVERAVLLCGAVGHVIQAERLPLAKLRGAPSMAPPASAPSVPAPATAPANDEEALRDRLQQVERDRVLAALAQCAGNQTQAAKLLGVSRNTLAARIAAFGLPRPRKRP